MSDEKQFIDVGTVLSDIMVALGHVSLGMQGIAHALRVLKAGHPELLDDALARLDIDVTKLWESWEKVAEGLGDE